MTPEEAVLNKWSDAAPVWERNREVLRQMFAPVTQTLIEELEIGSRQTVLDIATGPGEPALDIAPLVGPEGAVFGVDVIPAMIEAARRAADLGGFTHTHFDTAPADQLPFPADTFDAVVSRFGVMFFPSPLDAVREILRVLKPGRKFALAVWSFVEANPFFWVLSKVVDQYVESPVPDRVDAFRFAASGDLLEILAEAGATALVERRFTFHVEAPLSAEAFWQLRYDMSEKLRDTVAMLSPGQTTEMKQHSLEALRPYSTESGISFPAEVLIVSGCK